MSGTRSVSRSGEQTIDEVLEAMPVGWFHYRLLLMVGCAFAADAMEVGLLGFMSTCAAAEWDLDSTDMSMIASGVFAGELLGGWCFGPMADKYGRKNAYLVACALIVVAGVSSAAAPNLTVLVLLQAVVGVGVGGLTVPFDLLAEFLPASWRGQFLICIEYFWSLGSLFVAGMAWAFLNSHGWRFLTYTTAIPVAVGCALSFFYLPESPRWLLEKGRVAEAEVILKEAARVNGCEELLVNFKLAPLWKTGEEPEEGTLFGNIVKLVSPENRWTTIPIWMVWLSFGFSYYGIILFVTRVYSTGNDDDLSDDGYTCDFDYEDIFANAAMELVGLAVATAIIDRVGRVGTQFYGYALAGIGSVILSQGSSSGMVTGFGMMARAAIMCASCATWVHTPELYSTDLRATGHSICNVVARIGALFSPFVVNSNAPLGVIGFALMTTNFVAVASVVFLPETLGLAFDEIENGGFKDKSNFIRTFFQKCFNCADSSKQPKYKQLSSDDEKSDQHNEPLVISGTQSS